MPVVPTLRSILDAYYDQKPGPENPAQRVSFGTSGHRGSSLAGSFTESHIAAITQAVIEHRTAAGITGPLYIGKDTHALSGPALDTALEVLAAHGVETRIQGDAQPTPAPSWLTTPTARPLGPTALSSPPPTTPPKTAASNTTNRTAARPVKP